MPDIQVPAKPSSFDFSLKSTALIIIDMQRDFLETGGFGSSLGNDVSMLRNCIAPIKNLLESSRRSDLFILHTREGHREDLSDVHPEKQARCSTSKKIGDNGPMGRILVRNQPGHGIIEELAPRANEPVIDKPGKGAFFSTDLDLLLRAAGITTTIICGVTTEVCVHTTVREANDRGYRVLVPEDCCGSYFPEFHRVGIEMISAQGGIFGHVTDSEAIVTALDA